MASRLTTGRNAAGILPRRNLRIVKMPRGREILSPDLRDFIDRCIVPALADKYFAELQVDRTDDE